MLTTITGEPFQPVRLHYQVFDPSGLRAAFRTLRCLEPEQHEPRWVWVHDHEARDLPLPESYARLKRHLRPLVLGTLELRKDDLLLVDLRCGERAVAALTFFAQHLPRNVARVSQAQVVIQLFPAADNLKRTPADIFDQNAGPSAEAGREGFRFPIQPDEEGMEAFSAILSGCQTWARERWGALAEDPLGP
jgi:hypothetical protein